MFDKLDFLKYFPENVSTFGHELDHLFEVIWYIDLLIFFLTFGLLITFLIKYRYKPGVRARGYHGNNTLEFTWTILPTLLFAGLGLYSDGAWETTKNQQRVPNPDIEIQVIGMQYQWMFRYPGADGILGRTHRRYMSSENLFGIDTTDPYGVDDIEVNQMHLPINKNVLVHLTSRDVLHSFFLPNFRVKQDAVPGNFVKVWFNGTKVGKYEIACAELCGASHYNMKGYANMYSLTDFNTWYDEQMKVKAESLNPSPAAEPTPDSVVTPVASNNVQNRTNRTLALAKK